MSDITEDESGEAAALAERVQAAVDRVKVLSWIAPENHVGIRRELHTALDTQTATIDQWSYRRVDSSGILAELRSTRSAVDDLAWEAPGLHTLAASAVAGAEAAVRAISSRDDATFVGWSRAAYGLPSATTLSAAYELLGEPGPIEPPRDIPALELVGFVNKALSNYGLSDWTGVTDDTMVATASVRSASNRVTVRSDALFSDADVRRLLVHEVGVHVLRTVNARRQRQSLARLSAGRSAETEEGLAAWHEELFGVSSPATLRGYAARVVGVQIAETEGIVETARQLAEYVGPDQAIAVAIRVKRGLRDPNQPGSFSKDHAYLSGLLRLRAELAANPGDLALVMSTKWAIDELPLARALRDSGELSDRGLLADASLLGLPELPAAS